MEFSARLRCTASFLRAAGCLDPEADVFKITSSRIQLRRIWLIPRRKLDKASAVTVAKACSSSSCTPAASGAALPALFFLEAADRLAFYKTLKPPGAILTPPLSTALGEVVFY